AHPAATRPMLDPTSASIEMRPLALPRLPVGNSSAPYTPRAGTAAPPITAAAVDDTHMGQPPSENWMTVKIEPPASAIAPTSRRPRVSASFPPATMPTAPGVFVHSVNSEILAAL